MSRAFSSVIYGREGMGKTSIGLQFPGPVFCQSIYESGYDTLLEVPSNSTNDNITSFEQLLQNTQNLIKCTKGTLLIDACTGLERIVFDYGARVFYNGDMGKFMAYYNGPRNEAPQILQQYLDLCSRLVNNGMHVVFLAHEVVEQLPNAMGPNALCHDIQLDGSNKGGMRNTLKAWVDSIFFLNQAIQIDTATEKDRQHNVIVGKAQQQSQRYIYTSTDVVHAAKNRWNMPQFIPMGTNAKAAFNNLWSKIPERFRLESPSPAPTQSN